MEVIDVVFRMLKTPFHTLAYNEKVKIKKEGRPVQKLEIQKPNGKLSVFNTNTSWYQRYPWLTGSVVTKRLYCWPCLLVGKSQTWSVEGFNDVKNLDRATKRHDQTKEHIGAAIRLKLLGSVPVDQLVDEGVRLQTAQHNVKVRRNRDTLRRLIDATAYLGMQELAFRGQDEGPNSDNKGNYRELVGLIARYDNLLAEQQQSSDGFTGMSATIQNDLICAIGNSINNEITKELNTAPFFSWQIDETTDISCHSQLSIMARFVDTQGVIQERFLGFFDVSSGRDARSLFEFVQSEMTPYKFAEKLVAQTYDGAAVMASALNGLQAKVREVAPAATFVHCYAHRLNLVLSQGVKSIPKARVFFAHLGGFTSFFSKSSKRVALLEELDCARMPKTAPTRWNFSSRVVNTVARNHEKLLNTFTRVLEHPSMDDETTRLADGLKGKLEDFEFMFLLFTFEQLFAQTDILFNILQQKAMDVAFCKRRIEHLMQLLAELRSDRAFEETYSKAASVTEDPEFGHRRRRRQGEQSHTEFYRSLYEAVHDSIRAQLTQRFQQLDRLHFMELLDFEKFDSFKAAFPTKALANLFETYGHFFDEPKLKAQLQHYYSDDELHSSKKLCEAISFMKSNGLDEAMAEVYRLMSLIATIGATSAGVERSFSCLKRIKSFTRNSMGQERLKSLATISIERKMLKCLQQDPQWYEHVIDTFATQTSRRLDYFFK